MRHRRRGGNGWLVVTAMAAIFPVAAMAACSQAQANPARTTVHVRIHYSTFHPRSFTFPAGTAVRFVIHNSDPIDHEFIVGDRALQNWMEHTAHPAHDGSVPGQITVPAGTTRGTTYTFRRPASDLQFACHVRGHYAFGMHGPITVTT